MRLSGGYEDPFLDVIQDRVPHDGLHVWCLKARVRKDETLVTGIQVSKHCWSWIQEIKVPLHGGKEGSLSCVGQSLINGKTMICHVVCISQEDCGRLTLRIE